MFGLRKLTTRVVLAAALSTLPATALAGPCESIMRMLNVNLDVDLIIDNMASYDFTREDVQCLQDNNAPKEIVDVARAKLPAAEEPQQQQSAPQTTFDIDDDDDASSSGASDLQRYVEEYKAKRYLSASEGLFDLLEENAYPEKDSTIKYYLAKSLHALGLHHGAQHYYMEVIRKGGPKNPLFKHALPRLVTIAALTGNDYELRRIVGKIDPSAYPRQARPYLHYLMGRREYEDDQLADASSHFDEIPTDHPLYPRSQYFEGLIKYQQEKYKSSVKAFREVIRAEVPVDSDRTLRELEDLKDLSLINIGRIYYKLNYLDKAEGYYSKVSRTSTYWPESLFERAWGKFSSSDLNGSLGLLLTASSPFFAGQDFIPEISYLRALNYFNLCEYNEVERNMISFESDYRPMRDELRDFIERYKTKEGSKLHDQAFDRYFGAEAGPTALPKSFWTRILRSRDLASLIRHLDMLDVEQDEIDVQKASWRNSLGAHLDKVYDRDRQRYKMNAGRKMLQAMLNQYRIIDGLLKDADILRFEVTDAQREDYMFRASNPDVTEIDERPIDFATQTDIIYWPFNGEFWIDELGYYRFTEQGSCN